MERKSITFELKDMNREKRTAVIAHAVYDNIDRTMDISRKGMFTKSWSESKDEISFYLNHNDEQAPGKVVDVYEDNLHAYTKAWLGTHTLGNDTLIMMDEGVIKKASFGYITRKSNPLSIKGQKIRELKEVVHLETSVLTKMPANPKAGVRNVVKSFYDFSESKELNPADKELLDMLEYDGLLSHINIMEKFVRNTKASDDTIKSIQIEIENAKQLISDYNTADTQVALEPAVSIVEKGFLDALTTFKKTLITN